MGGTCAVTVREADGTEHRMARWTNALPWFIHNVKLLRKDPEHVKEYLRQWYEMRQDFEEHYEAWQKYVACGKKGRKKLPPFKYPMTDCYAPYPFLAPMGYGLVVVDLMQNAILSMQGYSQFSTEALFMLRDDMDEPVRFEFALERCQSGHAVLQVFNGEDWVDSDRPVPTTAAELSKMCQEDRRGGGMVDGQTLQLRFDMHPFKLKEHPENNTGTMEILGDVHQLGFTLTDEELKLWNEWIKGDDPTP